jgi:hypothetical protein
VNLVEHWVERSALSWAVLSVDSMVELTAGKMAVLKAVLTVGLLGERKVVMWVETMVVK